ncbi:MAG: multicopper oxidase domain-containing protein, partial [Bacillota bacterium]
IEAEVRDILYITIRNREIPHPVSLIFPGQRDVRVRRSRSEWTRVSPDHSGGVLVSLTNQLQPGSDARLRYLFIASRPGLFLYESGSMPEIENQMGLHGVLLVRPRGFDIPGHPAYRTAYGPGTGSGFDVEKILVLGEIDSQLHSSVSQGAGYDILKYSPDFWILNGRAYPDTLNDDGDPGLPTQPSGSVIAATAGQRVLLRIANAGFIPHTLHLGGLAGRVVAEDGFPLRSRTSDITYQKTAVTVGPGQTCDLMIVPEHSGQFFLRAREYNRLLNGDTFPGGIMARMSVGA